MATTQQQDERGVAHPTIKKGSKGDAVKLAQNRLNMRFYEPGPIDGLFGPKTAKAVRWYQRDRDLEADGIIGAKTWARLDPPTIRRGSNGDAVRLCQRILKDFDHEPYDPGKVDGDFGQDTERAVKRLQDDFGLEVDGVVGPNTWAMMGS
jgi:peptidoglycan hydrolase-like protein with peptidoglycan-binding domain